MNLTSKPNVLLLYPKTGMDFGSTVAPPHALLAIAAPLVKAGYRVKILDQRVEHITSDTLKTFLSKATLCVGISTMTGTQIRYALALAKMVREITASAVPIVWGGCHPSTMPQQTIQDEHVDIVSVGEGDETFLELVQALEHKHSLEHIKGIVYKNGSEIITTANRPLMNVEDLLPVPWELINVEKYIHPDMYLQESSRVLDIGQTSRGCPFSCGFCSSASIRGRKWRAMSAEKSITMIEEAVHRFNLNGIWLRDDEFYIDHARVRLICEGIIKKNFNIKFYTSGTRVDVFAQASDDDIALLKKAGAHTLKFGAESGSQRILDLMKKGITPEQTLLVNQRCRKHGIIPVFGFLVGYPTETFEEINQTIDFAFRLKKENPEAQLETIAIYTPLPGTPDCEIAFKHGLKFPNNLKDWANWIFDDYDLEGRRNPWYNHQERMFLGNITYMSILANAIKNIVTSLRNPFLRYFAILFAKPISHYFSWKLTTHQYQSAPELKIIRYLRSKVFYKTK